MNIKINGEIREIPEGVSTLLDLFEYLALKPQGRIVEHNGTLCLPEDFAKTQVNSEDVLEIIQFMGGGL